MNFYNEIQNVTLAAELDLQTHSRVTSQSANPASKKPDLASRPTTEALSRAERMMWVPHLDVTASSLWLSHASGPN